jgi:threonine dehydratase
MRVSAEHIAAARGVIAPALQHTPTRTLRALGCHLLRKDETAGPLGCFKGRGADLFVATAQRTRLGCASAGMVHAQTGVTVAPSTVVGLAAIAADRSRFANRRVATVVTGANLTREQRAAWSGL